MMIHLHCTLTALWNPVLGNIDFYPFPVRILDMSPYENEHSYVFCFL